MKRPEGFDPAVKPAPKRASRLAKPAQVAKPARTAKPPRPPQASGPVESPRSAKQPKSVRTVQGSAGSEKSAKRAARERRRFERDEVRRFTRRSRHRRVVWVTALAVAGVLIGTVAIAVYSPLLALTEIEVTGNSAVSSDDIVAAVDDQLGTPLALVNKAELDRALSTFTLIQSYVTETVPPNTLIVHVTERQPIGSIVVGSGFTVVDAAGVKIDSSAVRPEGVPLLELVGNSADSEVFDSVVEVLLALPEPVSSRVDRVTAATRNNVTLVLDGAGQRVVWGSAEQSELKSRVLNRLMATQDSNAPVEFDVSAPLSAVVRPV